MRRCAAGVLCLILAVASVSQAGPIAGGHAHRSKREASAGPPTLADRTNCQTNEDSSSIRVNTTQRLAAMREAMKNLSIHAFIVLSDDAHGSEYPSEHDERRGFISGFTGSAGQAVVTLEKAALWTDGRYFVEAEQALDCNWIFMRSGQPDVPSVSGWLITELANITNAVVGADAFLVSNSQWQALEKVFMQANITLKHVSPNPVDTAWGPDQPALPVSDLNARPLKFAGKTWEDKIADLRTSMETKNAQVFVVTSLDETAWLFNLRGSDISYNPVFLSYAIVEKERIRLYLLNKDKRLTANITDPERTGRLDVHLNTRTNGSCPGANASAPCVEVLEYDQNTVVKDVEALANSSKIWVTYVCNYAIFRAIPEAQRIQDRSTIALAKAMKNKVEREGMERCYVRDSLILIKFLAFLEKEVKSGRDWTEVSAAEKLKKMRLDGEYNRGLSFETISASGPNGAIVHYRPLNATNLPVNTSLMYLLDSGGQYLDGTTDVTRTMHYGTPSQHEKECYTRVLMGSIDLATLVWPEGLYGREIDMAARAPLWEVGLEYNHGTGHGIGAYLSVHEGPGRISLTHSANPSEETVREYMFFSDGPGFISLSKSSFYAQEELKPYMFFSDEPGYYETNKFGIRLETIVMVEPAENITSPSGKTFLRFKPMTLVPFEPNLIVTDLLSKRQIAWLNAYHQLVLDTMKDKNLTSDEQEWLQARVKPIADPTPTPSPTTPATGGSPRLRPVALGTIILVAATAMLYFV